MNRRPNRPRAIAVAAETPYAGPGHAVIIAALVALALLLFSNLNHAHAGLFGGPPEVKAQAGAVKIPVADVSDGKAHFYNFKTGGKNVQFFVIKSKDGQLRTALNACDVCFPAKKGYTQQGDYMVCNNCGQKFHSSRVMDVKGGCNPSPLARTIDGKNVVIREADLAAGVKYF
ncbi:Fe-S-containing protein [Humidesulfovibrio idahonensis]